jgi:aspartyl protease family protein
MNRTPPLLMWLLYSSAILLNIALPVQAQSDIQVRGLFKGSAVLEIDGRQHLLKVGHSSPEGVKLLAADPRQAVVEVAGERRSLGLSRQISSSYQVAEKVEFSVPINSARQYITVALINGRRVQVLIDTGANTIAMNSVTATRLGLNFAAGKPSGTVMTASGPAAAHHIKLNAVEVGGISANSVDAIIIEGDYPEVMLLGMSYLEHVNLREERGILYLKSKY